MPNRLAHETSPYLLQHANNPVDWNPWGSEAIERAKAERKPIFLSIGYSACHWCHVMEHESFENEAIARVLNEGFVPIKVDREERPDLDQIYMQAVQMMTGRGGWPMSMFLTPELEPFYGGTYWPPTGRMGMPGFDQVLAAVAEAWRERREVVLNQAAQLTAELRKAASLEHAAGELSLEPLQSAEAMLQRSFDRQHGGFGGAPKFPHPMDLRVVLRLWRRTHREELLGLVTLTLDKMAAGGIYDQLAGGFHRYSVDERWLVPHFEKMLYDNALLAACYLEAYQATRREDYARVAGETLDYTLREMTGPEGGFYSTQDADSEGEEGKFYVWTPAEIRQVLGEAAAKTFCYVYDVSLEGNFEGRNILNLPKSLVQCAKIFDRDVAELAAELAGGRAKLLEVRGRRVGPALDDKVLVSWNGLMIDAFSQAACVLGEPRYLAAATAAAEFISKNLRRGDGRLLHSWRAGRARFDAYLDDYACLANSLVSLYEAGFDEHWIDLAVELADVMLAQFADVDGGGFFYTACDHEPLIARQKDVQDSSTPSGNAMAATALLRLGKLCGRQDYLAAAERTLATFTELMTRHPTAAGQLLIALDFERGPSPELVLMAPASDADAAAVLGDLRRRYLPNKVVARRVGGTPSARLDAIFAGKPVPASGIALYVCRDFTCQAPAVGRDAALGQVSDLP
ncbi:MAG TPA: thioredoxin domain-containing protein [Pirellulales bacterium]|nr:thioredoxin domain-containing protein [Pirellulales bacterium]